MILIGISAYLLTLGLDLQLLVIREQDDVAVLGDVDEGELEGASDDGGHVDAGAARFLFLAYRMYTLGRSDDCQSCCRSANHMLGSN